MFRVRRLYIILSSVVLLLIGSFVTLRSQTAGRELIREKVDNTTLVTLAGNTRPEANAANDLGEVADDFRMDHIMLQLKRSPQQEQAAGRFVDELQDPKSPNYHKWLTAAEFGKSFGVAESDVQTISDWLQSQGFTVNSVYPSGMVIDFSGNAGQVRGAFHTSIHNLNVNGVHHIANFSDPQIPQALAPAVAGIVSLHDFRPHKMSRARKKASHPQYTFSESGQPLQAVVPADLATIYDFNPLFAKGITGMGQTIVVLEDTDLYSASDWTTFRNAFGLSQYSSGSLTTVHPAPASGANNCSDPSYNSDDDEAILDAEWASAAAPGAAVLVAACADTNSTFGVLIAAQNLVNAAAPPAIVSISYGECEAENGAASNASVNALYQQAVAEGVSVFVAAGDEGAAGCDAGEDGFPAPNATHGIAVSAYASTQYNVAVGGTDFSDVLNGTTATYWSRTNTATYGSALSYIPEIPWNNSCAGSLFAKYSGYATGYGPGGLCESISNTPQQEFNEVVAAGSGGPSNCFTGVPSTVGVSNGTCQGYAKPSWQTGLSGIPNDGVRDIPDVSLFAADGAIPFSQVLGEGSGHFSIVCFTDPNNGGSPCRGAPGPAPIGNNWSGFGGTSIATPEMAGLQALVNQKVGARQGNPSVVYYALAASTPSAFHPVTQGDIAVNCSVPVNCYGIVGTVDYGRGGRIFATSFGGALSVSDTSFTPAYAAGPSAWNFANGIGSVDANNLVTNWPTK